MRIWYVWREWNLLFLFETGNLNIISTSLKCTSFFGSGETSFSPLIRFKARKVVSTRFLKELSYSIRYLISTVLIHFMFCNIIQSSKYFHHFNFYSFQVTIKKYLSKLMPNTKSNANFCQSHGVPFWTQFQMQI